MPGEPAQKKIVEKYLDWKKVEERLGKYKHICEQYPIADLEACSGPYYCHYLSWRLGTWNNDDGFFEKFDELLELGSSLPNWKKADKNRLKDSDFADFFGVIWELQVARLFSSFGDKVKVEWTESGPDLKVQCDGETFYVECYTYRKSFGLMEYIEELFVRIDKNLRVRHRPYLPLSLPQNRDTEKFLGEIFNPYLDAGFLEAKKREAERESPVLLPVPRGTENLYIYLEGSGEEAIPNPVPSNGGDPERYLSNAVEEALNNKKNNNRLADTRPNLLAVNFFPGHDFEAALSRDEDWDEIIDRQRFGGTYDALLLGVCGIDQVPSIQKDILKIGPGCDHPVTRLKFGDRL